MILGELDSRYLKIAYEKDDQSPLAFKIGPIHTLPQAVDQSR